MFYYSSRCLLSPWPLTQGDSLLHPCQQVLGIAAPHFGVLHRRLHPVLAAAQGQVGFLGWEGVHQHHCGLPTPWSQERGIKPRSTGLRIHPARTPTEPPTPQPASPGCPSVLSTSLLVDYIWWEKDYQKSSVIVKKKGKKNTNPKQETVTVSDKSWLFLGIELRSVPAGSFSALSVTSARKHDLTCTNFGDVGWEEKVSLRRAYKQALGSATSLLSLLPLSGWPRPLTPAHFHSAKMRRAALWKRSGRAAHRGTVR